MTHGSLFSGIGGFDLAAHWAGFTNLWACEIDDWSQQLLKKRFPNSTIYGNILTTDWSTVAPVDIVSGGFPCQPFSSAGKRKGAEDSRFLFPKMLEVIATVRPRWVVGENVGGLLTIEDGRIFDDICTSLANQGYKVWPVVIPASALGAPHRRDRIWVIAHANDGHEQSGGCDTQQVEPRHDPSVSGAVCGVVTNADHSTGNVPSWDDGSGITGFQKSEQQNRRSANSKPPVYTRASLWESKWPEVASRLCRVDDGLSAGVDRPGKRYDRKRLRGLGNAIVPQVAHLIFEIIKEIEA